MRAGILLAFLFLSTHLLAQPVAVNSKIREVENGLIPYVPVNGFKSWNILERMAYHSVPGVSIAVINDYKIEWAKGYGLADTLHRTPVKTNTMFSAGSISKFLLAAAALKLVEEGRLSLDEPINNYLTSWKVAENEFTRKTPITLRLLLSHQAGTTQSSYFGFTPDKKPLPTVVDILSGAAVAETRAVVVNSEPGKEFRYSGGGSMIAQLALMDVTKQSFEDLTQQVLFQKLGMANTTFAQPVPAHFADQLAWAYSSAPWFKGMPYVYPQQAAAGLYSTPTDIAQFLIDVQKSLIGKGKVLSQTMAQQMMTPQVSVSDGGYREQMGIGPFLIQRSDNQEQDGLYFEFTGVNAGFLAYAIASVKGGKGVVIMLNSGDDVNGLGKEIRRAVAKAYGWKNFLPEEVQPIQLSEKELDELAGRYRKGPDEVVYLKKEKGYLVETINEGKEIYCFPVSKDSVVFTDFNVKGGFLRDEQGRVKALQTVWQQEPMPKMKADEFTPSEYMRLKRYQEAKAGFRAMKLNEYQFTYIAYDLMNRPAYDPQGVETILEVATELHPQSSIVYSRWGDYYKKRGDKEKAMLHYQKAVELDPADETAKENLKSLAN